MYTLEDIKKATQSCRKCNLHTTRTKTVFGEGNEKADIMFIGEGPGYNENQQGRPFVGAAGKLLDKMIEAIGLRREDVYIANIVKCRPPDNRNPFEDEGNACIDYLRWQVKLVNPKIIVCLGAIASRYIIKKDFKVTSDRGIWIKKGRFNIISTYHPAALLRDENKKAFAWEDFKNIRDKYKELKYH